MKITFRGHNFFEVETKGTRIVIDPFHENGMTKVKPEDLKPDLVLLTHGHEDHTGCVLELDAPVVAVYEIAQWLERKGRKAVGMNIGGFYEFAGIRIWMAPAVHSSGLPTKGETLGNGGSPAGFVIDDGETRFYVMGDTGLFSDLKHVVRDLLKPHVVAVPIGDLFTMGPEHAAIAVEWLDVTVAIPCHYDTFQPIEQDPADFIQAVGDAAVVNVMQPDTTIEMVGGRIKEAAVTA